MTTYYDRVGKYGADGGLEFQTADDRASEEEVAAILSQRWNCEFGRFGHLSALDWFVTRHGRMIGVAELKTRSHPSTQFPTVWLNVRKWLALQLMVVAAGVQATFVVRFTDGIFYCRLADIDAQQMRVAGCKRVVKARSDIEPVIDIPVSTLTRVMEAA